MNKENFRIESKNTTPYILLDGEAGVVEISGKSVMPNPPVFYNPIINWCKTYLESPCPQTTIKCRLRRFNTSSSKMLYHLFKTFDVEELKNRVIIQWIIDDADDGNMLCCGEDFQSLIKHISFKIVEE